MTQFTDQRKRGNTMTPEVFAQAIISIEHNYGLKLDARSVWLRMDAIACGRGWVGTKPGCKRGKSGENAVGKSDQKVESVRLQPISEKKIGAACGKGWEGTKPGCKRIGKGRKSEPVNVEKIKVEPKIEQKQPQSAPESQRIKPVKSPIEAGANTEVSKFDRVTGLKDLDKDWGESLKEGQKYMDSDMQHLNESIEAVEYLQGEANELKPKEEKTFWYEGGQKSANKEEWIERFSKDQSALKQKIKIKLAKMGSEKDLGTDGTEKLRANLSIIASIQEVKNKKSNDRNTITGGVTVGGKLQAAYVLTKKNDHLYVEYLAANPSNFLGKSGATKGAGRAAIVDIVKRSFEEGHKGKVQLESLTGAEGFYKKMGFTMSDRGDFRLSTAQAKKILEGKA